MTVSLHNIEAYINSTTALSVISASITIDEGWAPYCQATLEIPFDESILPALDPRSGVRIKIYATQTYGVSELVNSLTTTFGGGTLASITSVWNGDLVSDVSAAYFTPFNTSGINHNYRRSFDLTLRSRTIDAANSVITLDIASDEALLQDYALVATIPYVPTFFDVRTITSKVLNRIGSVLTPGTTNGTIASDAATWLPGQTAWEYLQPLIQSVGLRLYADENRNWYLVTSGSITPGLVELDATDTIVGASDSISRDDNLWFDAVVITYRWTNSLGETVIAYDTAANDPFSKVVHFEYETAYPGPGGAAAILARAQTRGRTNNVSAISDYRVSPTTACTISLPSLPLQTGTISAVTWNYPSDEMTVKTRTE